MFIVFLPITLVYL